MTKKLFLTAMIVVAGIFICTASKIDGKWKTTVESPNGSMELVYTFKVDGDKLTGTSSSEMGDSELKNGKVNGNEFSFDIEMMDMKITHKCKLDGDVIKMKVEMGDMGGGEAMPELILKKVE